MWVVDSLVCLIRLNPRRGFESSKNSSETIPIKVMPAVANPRGPLSGRSAASRSGGSWPRRVRRRLPGVRPPARTRSGPKGSRPLDVLPRRNCTSGSTARPGAAAGLDHPNIVPVYEAGEAGPTCYIASAYCPGPTLGDWLRGRTEPVPFAEAATLAAALADAAGHAHDRGSSTAT